MRIPILAYHSMNIHGNEYANNDLLALASDIRQITSLGLRIVPLHKAVQQWVSSREGEPMNPVGLVALTCDDGPDFDFRDLEHPAHGRQRSVLNILRDFQREHPRAQPDLHVTAFVIVSPAARIALDVTCMVGKGWWNDDWWPKAVRSGLMGIGNHSWDHNHESLTDRRPFDVPRGNFRVIDDAMAADYEIIQADAYLRHLAPNPSAGLFAYPYGQDNDFLALTYLPQLAATRNWIQRMSGQQRFAAAFTTTPAYWTEHSDRWRLPRFTCGLDWKSPAQLDSILKG